MLGVDGLGCRFKRVQSSVLVAISPAFEFWLGKKSAVSLWHKVPLSPSSSSSFFFSFIDINNQITSSLLKSQPHDSATKLAITQLSVRPHVICCC